MSDDEIIARGFHEAYERLAPSYGYKTREASAVEWDDVPEPNKSLMIAVAGEVRESLWSMFRAAEGDAISDDPAVRAATEAIGEHHFSNATAPYRCNCGQYFPTDVDLFAHRTAVGVGAALRTVAEQQFYDGDRDQPWPGYGRLMDRAAKIDGRAAGEMR